MAIDILPGAESDLLELEVNDTIAFGVVVSFLEEAEADQSLIDKFTTHGDSDFGELVINVKRWMRASRAANLFRIRILDTPASNYRIVYGFDWRSRRIGILAVKPRWEIDYEINTKLAERIFEDWNFATGGQFT